MGRAPCCDKANVKKGPWSPEEDAKLKEYISKHGTGGNWIALPQKAGLRRCGKSCRLRWLNYLRPNIKHGEFSDDEDRIICTLFASIGSRWSIIAAQLPGRTDNDIKNYWNTKLKKKLMGSVVSSFSHKWIHQQAQAQAQCTAFPPLIFQSSPYSLSTTGFESMNSPHPSNLLNTTIDNSTESYVGPIMDNNYQVKESFLVFGGEAASTCSSSGSHGREMEQDYVMSNAANYHEMGSLQLQSYNLFNGGNSICEGYMNIAEKPSDHEQLIYGTQSTQMDYSSLEEIKQLISTNLCNNSMNLFVDENKAEEKVIMYCN